MIKTKYELTELEIEYLWEKGLWDLLEAAEVCVCIKCGLRLQWQGEVKGMCAHCGGN